MIVAAAPPLHRHPAGARRARLARLPAQHVPQRDDAADHGDQLLRFDAAHLRGARPADGGRRQARPRSATRCAWSGRPASSPTPPPGLSLLGLLFSDSDLIRAFGAAGFLSILIALATVLALAPALGVLIAPPPGALDPEFGGSDAGVAALRRFCDFVAQRMLRRPGLNAALGLFVVVALGWTMRGCSRAIASLTRRRTRSTRWRRASVSTPSSPAPIRSTCSSPSRQGADLYAPETLQVIGEAHRIMEEQPGIANVWSLETLRRWLAEKLHRATSRPSGSSSSCCRPFLVHRFIPQDGARL